mmetsp:Transcript_10213/g.30468  ORF Transcript_10213/g.30468 Transcript_10213/m.30468 type:complete len:336 (+) Transcript_10213:46-1053(+)
MSPAAPRARGGGRVSSRGAAAAREMSAHNRRGDWAAALQIFATATAALGNRTHNAAVYVEAIRAHGALGRPARALDTFQTLQASSLPPSLIGYTAAIRACATATHWPVALSLLQDARDEGLSPNTVSTNCALAACEAGGAWRDALALLDEAAAPDAISFHTAIAACRRAGGRPAARAALRLLRRMRAAHVRPSLIGYTTVMNALSAAGYVRPALLVFRALCADHDPDERAVHTALRACDGAGRRADGLALLAELAESGAAGEKLARRFRPLWDAKAAAAHKAPAAAAAVAGGSGRGRGRTRGGSGRGSAAPPQWRRRSRRSRKGPPPEHEAARGD